MKRGDIIGRERSFQSLETASGGVRFGPCDDERVIRYTGSDLPRKWAELQDRRDRLTKELDDVSKEMKRMRNGGFR